ncbi:MAG: lytic murein transglycosylase [Agarilytica sp.]
MNQVMKFAIREQVSDELDNLNTPCGQQALFCRLYRERDLSINLVHQINHLVKDVQRHRGVSMGLLAGNKAFENDFYVMQNQISRRLSTLSAFAVSEGDVFGERERQNVQIAWDSIRHNWQGDKLSDNFELHSHFIEQLFQIVNLIRRQLEPPLLANFAEEVSIHASFDEANKASATEYSQQTKQIELLQFTCLLLPTIVETLAKIRGLASFSAAVGSAQYDHDRKLRFLVQTAKEQNERLRQRAQRLHAVIGSEFNAKYIVGELETKFVHLIELVIHDVLSGKTIHASSSQLFNLATNLIDKYWSIVDDGLDLVRHWHREELERWITMK